MSSLPFDRALTGENPSRPYSMVAAAGILGVNKITLAKWIEQGCPVQKRGNRTLGQEGEILIPAVVRWLIDRSVSEALSGYQDTAGKITKDEADRRRAIANAVSAEIQADEALGAVLSREDAEADVTAFCAVLMAGLSNAASKLASRTSTMTNASEIADIAQAELNRAFEAAREELERRWNPTEEQADGSAVPA